MARYEANLIAGLVQYLLKQGYTEQGNITVLTPYLGQLFVLRDVVGRVNVLHVQVCATSSSSSYAVQILVLCNASSPLLCC